MTAPAPSTARAPLGRTVALFALLLAGIAVAVIVVDRLSPRDRNARPTAPAAATFPAPAGTAAATTQAH